MKKIACLGAMIAACAAFAGTYTWNGASGGDWAVPDNWLVGGAVPATAPTSADNIAFDSASSVTVGGSTALAITQIANTGAGSVTFSCPVQFAGTYYVTQNGAVKFPGGATATYPDPALRTASSSDRTRTLDGDFTFTVDYADKPTRGRIPVCPLYGLTEEAVQAKVTVTVAGAPVDNIQVKVENGTITLRNTSGTLLFFR